MDISPLDPPRRRRPDRPLVFATLNGVLGRLLDYIRGNRRETVHQKAVAVIVIVEDPPQLLPGRQAPVPLQFGRNRSPVDGCDPMIFHSGNGILSDCNLKRAGGIDHAVRSNAPAFSDIAASYLS